MEFGVLWMRLPGKVRPTIAMGEGRRAQALCRARISLPKPPNPGVLADKVITKCVRVTETRQ